MKHLFASYLLVGFLIANTGIGIAQNQLRSSGEKDGIVLNLQINGNKVIVQNASPRSTIQIYNVLGVKLKEYKVPANGDNLQFDLPKGCFILKSDNVVRKIAIK